MNFFSFLLILYLLTWGQLIAIVNTPPPISTILGTAWTDPLSVIVTLTSEGKKKKMEIHFFFFWPCRSLLFNLWMLKLSNKKPIPSYAAKLLDGWNRGLRVEATSFATAAVSRACTPISEGVHLLSLSSKQAAHTSEGGEVGGAERSTLGTDQTL